VTNFERLTEKISNTMSLIVLLSLWKRRSLINTIIRSTGFLNILLMEKHPHSLTAVLKQNC